MLLELPHMTDRVTEPNFYMFAVMISRMALRWNTRRPSPTPEH